MAHPETFDLSTPALAAKQARRRRMVFNLVAGGAFVGTVALAFIPAPPLVRALALGACYLTLFVALNLLTGEVGRRAPFPLDPRVDKAVQRAKAWTRVSHAAIVAFLAAVAFLPLDTWWGGLVVLALLGMALLAMFLGVYYVEREVKLVALALERVS